MTLMPALTRAMEQLAHQLPVLQLAPQLLPTSANRAAEASIAPTPVIAHQDAVAQMVVVIVFLVAPAGHALILPLAVHALQASALSVEVEAPLQLRYAYTIQMKVTNIFASRAHQGSIALLAQPVLIAPLNSPNQNKSWNN